MQIHDSRGQHGPELRHSCTTIFCLCLLSPSTKTIPREEVHHIFDPDSRFTLVVIEVTGAKLRVAQALAFTCTSLNAPTIGDTTNTSSLSTGTGSPDRSSRI